MFDILVFEMTVNLGAFGLAIILLCKINNILEEMNAKNLKDIQKIREDTKKLKERLVKSYKIISEMKEGNGTENISYLITLA